ncbi:MAG TPA: hypothetical protein VIP08_11740 [Phenylobacterium sp.]
MTYPIEDRLAYWLGRLSEGLQRLNQALLGAGASPGSFALLLSEPGFEASPLAQDVRAASAAMRRFADLVFEDGVPDHGEGAPVWEDMMASLKLLLSACAMESELWLAADEPGDADPGLLGELRATVHAIETLCRQLERVH